MNSSSNNSKNLNNKTKLKVKEYKKKVNFENKIKNKTFTKEHNA